MASSIELIVVNDNTGSPGFLSEWGWSLLVVTDDGRRILFDFDTSPAVLEHNFRLLGIKADEITIGVLSHRHMDHIGGLPYVLKGNPGLELYVTPDALQRARQLRAINTVVAGDERIMDDIWVIGPLSAGYIQEQAMAILLEGYGLLVVVGCSHPGIDRIVRHAEEVTGHRIYHVIGGFHEPSREALHSVALRTRYITPAHCSGSASVSYIRNTFPGKLVPVRTGSRLTLPFTG